MMRLTYFIPLGELFFAITCCLSAYLLLCALASGKLANIALAYESTVLAGFGILLMFTRFYPMAPFVDIIKYRELTIVSSLAFFAHACFLGIALYAKRKSA